MWKDLTLEQKAEIMKMSVANGVTDINDIRALYDGSVGHELKEGGPSWSSDPASMIEHFEGFRESPYRDGTAWSVGYGQYMKGYGANLDWKALLSGKKKLTREEAHSQVLRTVEDLKKKLKNTLGKEIYDNLTPGQLMGYLDTGYQRPASMINAAKVHRSKGANAAANVLGVNGFADRNAARRAAFTGNWNTYKAPKGNTTKEYTPNKSSAANYNRQLLNRLEAPAFQPITITPQQNQWTTFLEQRNPLGIAATQTQIPIIPISNERESIVRSLPMLPSIFSYLPDQQVVTPTKVELPQYNPITFSLLNEPYLLFGKA